LKLPTNQPIWYNTYVQSVSLSVIIPVYNEIDTIEKLLEKVKASPVVEEIIIVDDFSTDGSREYLKGLSAPRIKTILQKQNQGKGAAITTGLSLVKSSYVIVQDADLEYDPKDYLRLLEAIDKNHSIVFGSRFRSRKPQMRQDSYYANMFLTFLTNLLFGSHITDMASCYKLIPTEILRSLNLKSRRFEIELEITTKLLSSKRPIKEIPISFTGRNYSEGKKIGWKDGVKDLWLLFKYRFLGFEQA